MFMSWSLWLHQVVVFPFDLKWEEGIGLHPQLSGINVLQTGQGGSRGQRNDALRFAPKCTKGPSNAPGLPALMFTEFRAFWATRKTVKTHPIRKDGSNECFFKGSPFGWWVNLNAPIAQVSSAHATFRSRELRDRAEPFPFASRNPHGVQRSLYLPWWVRQHLGS